MELNVAMLLFFAVDKGSGQILETCTPSEEPIILTADATAIYVDFSGKGNLTAEGFQVSRPLPA
jgi:hypothetical protein